MRVFVNIVILYVLITPFKSSNAGSLDGVLDGMFANVTAPQFSKDQYRGTLSFGSAYVRSPISSLQVASFDPPRVSVGCGGIDLYGGSFSFITADMLSQFIRNIAQNAAPLAFKLALDAVSPNLGAALNKWQDMAQKMNLAQKNSCEITQGVFDAGKIGGLQGVVDNLNNLKTGALATAEGWGNDFTEGLRIAVNMQDPTTPTPNKSFKNVIEKNPDVGNVVWNALLLREYGFDDKTQINPIPNVSGIADNSQLSKELIISLVGTTITTEIMGPAYPDQRISTARQSAGNIPVTKFILVEPTIHSINELLNPKIDSKSTSTTNTYSVSVLKCDGADATKTCLNMKPTKLDTPGVRGYVIKMMLGNERYDVEQDADPSSIIGQLTCQTATCSGISLAQQNFLNSLGRIPAVALTMIASRNGGKNLNLVKSFIIKAMTRQVSMSYIKLVQATLSSAYSNNSIPKPPTYDDVVKDLKQALATLESEDKSFIADTHSFIETLEMSNKLAAPLAKLLAR